MYKGTNFSRRKFLKTSGMAAGALLVGGGIVSSAVAGDGSMSHKMPAGEMHKAPALFRGKMFFTSATEFKTLSEATERIFPKDKNGPGAIELGVPYFIDNQLAGAYGYNEREYMQGPFIAGVPGQGYQTQMLRKDIFRHGVVAINDEARTKYKNDFADITDAQKDEILKLAESGEIKIEGVSSSYFFSLLKTMTLAGAYSDPIYNGNNNMDGWRMKNYPGAQMSYADIIESKKFEKIEPVSLSSMQ